MACSTRHPTANPTTGVPMAKLKGADKTLKTLHRLRSPQAKRRIGAALYVAGDMLRVEAAILITQGSVSGAGHVPSKPGEPPMNDTGNLASKIETHQISDFEVQVSSNAEYSAALELGTSKMAARPFMRPAAKLVEPKAKELVARALRDEFRKSRG